MKHFLAIVLIFIVLVGCSKLEPIATKNESTRKVEETSNDTQEIAEIRQSTNHPAGFDLSAVKVGDKIGDLKVKSIKIGDHPTYYVIIELEGELEVTGYYYQAGGSWFFQPDLASLDALPHIKDQYVRQYRDGGKVPRMTSFVFEVEKAIEPFSLEPRVGQATIELSNYKIQYAPELANVTIEPELIDGKSYIKLGDDLIPVGFKYVEDAAELVKVIDKTEYHYLIPPKDAITDEDGEIVWNNLKIGIGVQTAWLSSVDEPNFSALQGNHSGIMKTETLDLPDIGKTHLMVVERDKWDDDIHHYNGFQYEYHLIVLRDDPMVKLAGDDYLHAFYLVGVTDQQNELADKHIQELASMWHVPPEDFYH